MNRQSRRTNGAKGRPVPPRTDSMPTFIDAFAGCGGLSLGLMRAGWRGLLAIEKDPFAFETLSANFLSEGSRFSYAWPARIAKRPWDIRELLSTRAEELADFAGQVDLLAGGPPCQGFSHAGRRDARDSRNFLFEAYLQLVELVRPRLVLLENVLGFRHDFRGSDDPAVTNFAAALAEGLSGDYDLATAVLRADDYGVPQARPRFFLVGARRDTGNAALVVSLFRDMTAEAPAFLLARGLPQHPTAKDALSDLESRRNGTVPSPDSKGFEAIGYLPPRNAYQRIMRDGHQGPPTGTRLARHRPHIRQRFQALLRYSWEDGHRITVPANIRAAHGLRKATVRVLDPHRPAPTITSLPDDLLHYSEPRTLTVRETARLQSFPDWFVFKGNYTTGGPQRRRQVPQFTQVANAIPPLLAEQFGLRFLRFFRPARSTELGINGATDGLHRFTMPSKVSPKIRHRVIATSGEVGSHAVHQ